MRDSFESLLTRCQRHQRKKTMAIVRTTVLGLSSISALVWLFLFSDILDEQSSVSQKVKESPPKVVEKVVSQKVVSKTEPLRKDIQYDVVVDESYLNTYTKKSPVVIKKEKKVLVQKPTKKKTVLVSTKKIRTAKEMLKQYEREPNYDLALKISQYYFENQKYSKASLWAKKANILDKSSDKAWIMYAKSEYARGNKDRAKDILNLYLGNKNSKDAELLLMTWKQGK
ncbi:MAG: hypothetical protein U9R50_03555 [Campylobacterota bacterium]|nr:hypothetical protein [Campylobacterota bacterium]